MSYEGSGSPTGSGRGTQNQGLGLEDIEQQEEEEMQPMDIPDWFQDIDAFAEGNQQFVTSPLSVPSVHQVVQPMVSPETPQNQQYMAAPSPWGPFGETVPPVQQLGYQEQQPIVPSATQEFPFTDSVIGEGFQYDSGYTGQVYQM